MSLELGLRDYFGVGERRVVLVGVGNPIRGDDAVGPRIIELLESRPLENVLLLNTETVPEAFTGKVEAFKPTHVLVIDAANFRGNPGDTRLVKGEEIGGRTLSTHSLSLSIFISLIEESIGIGVLLLGIQPGSIVLGEPMTLIVEERALSVAETLYDILSN